MKFTVAFVTLLSISSTWAVLAKKAEEPKDKREAPTSYPQQSSGQSSVSYQAPSSSLGHGDASSISVGAGYSIGGAKPSYNFGGQSSSAGLQYPSEGLSAGHGGAIQLAPITLQPGQDLSQIMSQLQQSLGSAALTLQPSNSIAEFHESGQAGQQAYSFPQFQQYAAPQYQQYQLGGQVASAPSYAAGSKGLSSYQTGPVLFNPNQEHSAQQAALSYQLPSGGHGDAGALSLGAAGHSFPGFQLGAGHSLSGAGLSLPGPGYSLAGLGHSLGGAGLSFDGSGYTLGGAGHSLGGSGQALSGGYSLGSLGAGGSFGSSGHSEGSSEGHSLGGPGGHSFSGSGSHSHGGPSSSYSGPSHSYGSGSSPSTHYKVVHSGKPSPGKSSFKPSTFLGASIPSESSAHGASSFPGFPGGHGASFSGHGHSFPSFASYAAGAGAGGKQISPLYTKAEGSVDSAGAYSSAGHLASPPGTTYGFPTSSYSAGASQAALSSGPQYYTSPAKYSASFGDSYKSPSSSHSALSYNASPKYSFGSHSPRYASPKDSHGAFSETTYNTIKYSEELKPRA